VTAARAGQDLYVSPRSPSSPRAVFSSGFEPVFDHLTVDDGLPENSVRAITQDRFGFLWFGTQNGLVRYDGYDMTIFVPSPGDSNAFGGRTVQVLYQDREGDLWIGTFLNGLWHFDTDTDTFTGYSFLNDKRTDTGGGIPAPDRLTMAQNHPNPFNPTTTIEVGVPRNTGGPVYLKIYNVRGQTVKTLLEGPKMPGWYRFVWNGKTTGEIPSPRACTSRGLSTQNPQ
jgi:hypothetical protein